MVRFLADASLHGGIVSGCRRREPAMAFMSAQEAQLEGVADPDVVAVAAREDRIVVTSDLKTMPRYFGDSSRPWSHPRCFPRKAKCPAGGRYRRPCDGVGGFGP